MSMMWFGRPGTGAAFAECPQTETPVGRACQHCAEKIQAGESGWILADVTVMHHECLLRGVIGSVAHQQRRCSCYGGAASDHEEGMTRREGAKAALAYYQLHQGQKGNLP